jgi:beta-glucosidase-like glycosyl hydrolase/CubicO group peptidase (beta-lactamase class C family)
MVRSYFIKIFPLILFSILQQQVCANPRLNSLSSTQAQQWVDSVMNSLTLRERIAQLFMVAAYSNRDQKHVDEIAQLVREEKIGGLCFFQGGPIRQANLTNRYQKLAKVPLLISMDAEWGLGMRLDSTIAFPRQMSLGAVEDTRLVYLMGADIAQQLRRMGVHINFAPVIDVNNNALNPVINTRAFGEDKEAVTQKGIAYMLGLQDNGILACAKHFPGHGDTESDSHYELPKLNHSIERLDSIELYPFRKLIENGVSGVMVAHLEIPSLEPKSKVASSISTNIVTNLLINSLGFNGLIYTDALNMKGVSELYKPVELNYLSLVAGNDILLFPSEVKASINRIEGEVKKGRFPEEEINRRCRKIIEAKYRVGLNAYKPVKTKNLVSDLNKPSSELLIRQITEQAITVVNNAEALPIQRLDTLKIAYVEVGYDKGNAFREQMELYAPIVTYSINTDDAESDFFFLREQLSYYNLIIVGLHTLNSRPSRDYGVTQNLANFLSDICSSKKTIVSVFGSPYALSKMTNLSSIKGLIVAYDNSTITQSLTAQVVFGGTGSSGMLPVSATPIYGLGKGMETGKQIRLKYTQPEELHISSTFLQKIDSIAIDAIMKQATPGMQIIAARKGVVFYNKSFGNTTYTNTDFPVDPKTIYDVASLTKIAATLPSAMYLYSKGRLNLDSPLCDFITFPDTCNKRTITIRDILLHQAGLEAWIPFYQKTIENYFPGQPLYSTSFSANFPFQLAPNKFLNRNSGPSSRYFGSELKHSASYQVAKNIYAERSLKDSVFKWIMQSKLAKQGSYKYSDLGFMLLYRALDNSLQSGMEQWLSDSLYIKMGMNYTGFNPLKKFEEDRIAPTENDVVFRKQVVHGFVHDPAAALLGGVSGHAGLFSTANDMAKLMQMYLNKGTYGGEEFLPASAIDLFTSCISCKTGNRRGLGFDKPEPNPTKPSPVSREASSLSFGHSGFTGIFAWADPANDLVYIFVSNRVYPDAENKTLNSLDVRTKIHDVLYKAIKQSEQLD